MARWLLYITSVNRLMISKMKPLHGKSRSIICIANAELVFFCLSFFLQKNIIYIPCSVSIITWNLWTISFFALFCWFFVCVHYENWLAVFRTYYDGETQHRHNATTVQRQCQHKNWTNYLNRITREIATKKKNFGKKCKLYSLNCKSIIKVK